MHAGSMGRVAIGLDRTTEQLTLAEVSGQPFAPLTHASSLPQVPTTDVQTEASEILYTDTPRLLSSPTYSAMSASPALSSRHSPAAASAAAQPAAEVNEKMSAIPPTTQLVWEADTGGSQPVADSAADGGYTAAAFAALISPRASCCLFDTRAISALLQTPPCSLSVRVQESELQSRVCQLEQQLHQVESQRNSELQELQDMMASLKRKEQELTSFVESQAAAQEQQDELKQVVRNCEEKLKRNSVTKAFDILTSALHKTAGATQTDHDDNDDVLHAAGCCIRTLSLASKEPYIPWVLSKL